MKHIHLETVNSTQDYLLEECPDLDKDLLISCEVQTKGHGQHGKSWDSSNGSLCLSLTLDPAENITLTSLEVAVLLSNFIQKKFNKFIHLKWPNDLLINPKKCAGILLHNKGQNKIAIGIGINVSMDVGFSKNDYKVPAGTLFPAGYQFDKPELAIEIYSYLKENRLSSDKIITEWNKRCAHIKQEVIIEDQGNQLQGTFDGVGSNGEAIIITEGSKRSFYSGSLRVSNFISQ